MAKELKLEIVIGAKDNYSQPLTAAEKRIKDFETSSASSMGVTVNAMKKTADMTAEMSGALNIMKKNTDEASLSFGNLYGDVLSVTGGVGLFFASATRGRAIMSALTGQLLIAGRGLAELDDIYIKSNLGVFAFNRELFKSANRFHMLSLGLYVAGVALAQMDSKMAQMAGRIATVAAPAIMMVVSSLNMLTYMAGKAASWMGDKLVAANDAARESYDKLQFSLVALAIGIDDFNLRAAGTTLTMKELMGFTADLAAETGIATVEIKRGAAGLLEMNKTYGLTKDQLMQVMDRTAKFAVIMDIPFRSALNAVESAMSGNAVRARNMGLALNGAAQAHGKAGEAATGSARAFQVFGALMEQTKSTAERFPEALRTVIGQQNALNATMQDVNVTIGEGARLAWNPLINVINLYTIALRAIPDEVLGTLGLLREQAGVFLQIIGFTLKMIATLGTLFFVAKGFILMTAWVSTAGTAMAGFSGIVGLLGKAIVGLRTAMVFLRVSMLAVLGPIGLVIAAVGTIAWAYKKYTASVEAATLQNDKLFKSQKKLIPPNEEAQNQIERLILSNKKLGATKEQLLAIAIDEFRKTGANTNQIRLYTDALEAQEAKEAEIAARKKVDVEITPREFEGPEITEAQRLRAEYDAKLVIAQEASTIEAERRRTELDEKLADLDESLMTENDLLESRYDQRRFIIDSAYKNDLISKTKRDKLILAMDAKLAKDEAKLTLGSARLKLSVATTVFRNVTSLMQALPAANREAAIAMIAVDKGLAMAETFIWAEAAKMRAMAIGNPALVGVIEAMKWVSIGLIAATGIIQASTGSGGAVVAPEPATAGLSGAGTVNERIGGDSALLEIGAERAEAAIIPQQVIVNINVENMISSENLQEIVDEQVIPAINDATDRGIALNVA